MHPSEAVQLPPRRYKGSRDSLSQTVLKTLAEQGPMTTGEICIATGRGIKEIASIISRMCKPMLTLPKRVYIYGWVWEDEHSPRKFWRAQYAIGDAPDKRKPKPSPKAARMRHYYKTQTPNSIFDIATTRRERETRQRAVRAGRTSGRGPLQETEDSAN